MYGDKVWICNLQLQNITIFDALCILLPTPLAEMLSIAGVRLHDKFMAHELNLT